MKLLSLLLLSCMAISAKSPVMADQSLDSSIGKSTSAYSQNAKLQSPSDPLNPQLKWVEPSYMPSGNYVRAEGTAEFFVRPQIAVTGVKLTSEELEGKRSQMEQAALANAQMKAQNMAKVANKALGSILKVVYQSTDGKASDNALAPDASSNSTNSADMGRGSIHESGIAVVYYELVQDVPRLSGATDGVIVSKPRRR